MKSGTLAAAFAGLFALGGCVSTPQGPTVAVMPAAGKSLNQFSAESGVCQQYAQAAIASAGQAAHDVAAANAAGGAALGAVVGAMLGATTGLMFGGAAAGNSGAVSSYTLQRQYDIAYMQCMVTRGNQVPGRVVRRGVPGDFHAPSGYAAPPTGYAVPPGAIAPPPDTPPPPGYASPAYPWRQTN